ncbi:MAG: chemotaxis protein CheW [Pseudomonadales bacterium]
MATQVAQSGDEHSELSCIVVPMTGMQLLVPSVCIAEILPWRRFRMRDDGPSWYLGHMGWRGESVPVVRFERLNQPRSDCPRSGRCLVIMNRSGNPNGQPFYALVADGLPRMVQLTQDDVSYDDSKLGRAEAAVLRLGTESATVPNLLFLEQQIAAV